LEFRESTPLLAEEKTKKNEKEKKGLTVHQLLIDPVSQEYIHQGRWSETERSQGNVNLEP